MSVLPVHDTSAAVNDFRVEVRAWLAAHWTPEMQAAHRALPFRARGFDLEFSKRLGRDGWIGIGWPKQYGGQGRSPEEQLAFIAETARSGAPVKAHTLGETIVGPALFIHGTQEQKDEWLPAIKMGERPFALGYSEAGAGSDLASLRTRADCEVDEWVVNGEKLWSTNADKAEYIWLAARTDTTAKKHHGISVFMLDLRAPGVSIQPSLSMSGRTFSTIFFDNVRVPAKNLVGKPNAGWTVITDALAAERVMIGGERVANLESAFDHLTDYIKATVIGGVPLKRNPIVRDRIGALAADLEVARRFHMRNCRMVEQGRVPVYEAAMGKVFASELQERLGEVALDILGAGGLLSEDSPSAPLPEMEQLLRHSIMNMIGGGTNEIQRSIIAFQGLGLPR